MNAICQLRAANSCDLVTHETEVVVPDDDLQGNYPSLRSRPAEWLCVDDAAIAVTLWVHDAIRNYAWYADSHLMNMTTWVGATESGGPDDSGQASGLPHLGPHHAVDEAPLRTTTSRFVYDALHRRVGRVKDDGEVTVFVYEGWNVIEERTVCGGGVREGEGLKLGSRFVWGEDLSGSLQGAGGIGGLLSSVQVGAATGNKAEGTTSFFHYDSNGNVILLTDGRGRESARYSYDAFGKTLTATGLAARVNRYRFSTKPVEEESGLVYYGYRYYDPVTGRWPSRDPIGELGGVNVYASMNNEAVNHNDLLGQVICGSLIELGMRLYRAIAQCNSCSLELNCTHCCSLRRDLDIIVASVGLLCDGVEALHAGAASRGVLGIIDGVLSWDQYTGLVSAADDRYANCVADCLK